MTETYTSVVLTGASGGLGRALAGELGRPGTTLLLLGRDPARLDAAADAARARGADAFCVSAEIDDHAAVAAAIADFNSRAPIDLVIANAGVKCGNAGGIEPWAQTARVINVNLLGAIAVVQAALPFMTERGHGRIALVSSLSAHAPQADLLSYSATKAAVRAYGIALRRRLRSEGVGVTLIEPGFVDTPMTHRHLGWTPGRLSAPAAARRIVRGLERGRAVVGFPYWLSLLSRLDPLLPAALSDRLNAPLRAEIRPDPDEAREKPSPTEGQSPAQRAQQTD